MYLSKLYTILNAIQETLRSSVNIQKDQLSEVRSCSERYWKRMAEVQGTKQYKDEVLLPEEWVARHNHISEGRKTGVPLQARTYQAPPEVEALSSRVYRAPPQSRVKSKVPLPWDDDLDYRPK